MEPLTSSTIAIATLILNKAFEKTGEKLGEAISQQVSKLKQLVLQRSLTKTSAIEKANHPVNFGQAVLELEAVSAADGELAQALDELAASVEADPILLQRIQKTAQIVQAEPTIVQNNVKLAEKLGVLVQGGTVHIDNMSF
jgi:hypothetical protein